MSMSALLCTSYNLYLNQDLSSLTKILRKSSAKIKIADDFLFEIFFKRFVVVYINGKQYSHGFLLSSTRSSGIVRCYILKKRR